MQLFSNDLCLEHNIVDITILLAKTTLFGA